MQRLAELSVVAIAGVVIIGCSALSQQKAQPPHPDDLKFHNLQVLPQNITHDELIGTMRGFTRALGVKCGHCHARPATAPAPESLAGLSFEERMSRMYDFPSDAKREKASARTMIGMVRHINHDYISKVEDVYTTVSCWTCHRGKTQPDIQPSAPLEGQPPPPTPPATSTSS